MQARKRNRVIAALLALALLTGLLAGCTVKGGQAQNETQAAPETTAAATEAPPAPTEPEDDHSYGASWQQIFGDKDLPVDGWLRPDEVGFYRTEEDGTATVIVMTIDEMHQRLSKLGNLPRTRYFENMLDERFGLLFSTYDMALELGSRFFSFPTSELRARDAAELGDYFECTYMLYGSEPHYSVTKDLENEVGEKYRFLTVQLAEYTQEQMEKYHEGVEECRRQLSGLPSGLDEFNTALLLYLSVTTIEWDNDAAYDDNGEYIGVNPLYTGVCQRSTDSAIGYAISLYTLFNLAGIDCLYVSGPLAGDDYVYFTGWNIAKLGDNYYLFDPFLDSILSDDVGSYLFFAVQGDCLSQIYQRTPRKNYEGLLPECPRPYALDMKDPHDHGT